ncbi:MAG: hypothetical protein GF375_03520 [Candidatus Omnitrophica bacterium]|nr:hypothetical protein [Candidatus Omnitrophota bacterium]
MTRVEAEKFIEGVAAVFVRFTDMLGATKIEVCGKPYVLDVGAGPCLCGNKNFVVSLKRVTGLQEIKAIPDNWYEGEE